MCPDEEGIETGTPRPAALESDVAMPCPDEEGIETRITGGFWAQAVLCVAMTDVPR